MSETTAETTEVQERPSFPDEMSEASFNVLVNLIEQRNAKVGQINAAKGDSDLLREQIQENSDDAEIVSLREARDEAKAAYDEAVMALDAAVRPKVHEYLADAEASVKQTEEEVKELDAKIKPGTTYLKKMYGESLAKHLPSLARLKGFSTKGAGASGRRVRGFYVVVDLDGEETQHENFAQAAKFLDVETAVLQEAFFKAAGKDSLKEIGDRVDFSVEYTDTDEEGNESTYTANLVAFREQKDDEPEAEVDTEDED